jgi:hypothetical protein
MARKRISSEDRDVLKRLVEDYSATVVIGALKKMTTAPLKKSGAPRKHRGNLASVYAFIKHHKAEKNSAGRPIGIDGACKRLKARLDMHTNCRTTWKRFRSMYYEAIKLEKTDPQLAAEMKAARLMHATDAVVKGFPLLLTVGKSGDLEALIDTTTFKTKNAIFTGGPFNKIWVCDAVADKSVPILR